MKYASIAAPLLVLAMTPGVAMAASGQVEVNTAGDFQRKEVTYNCGAEGPLRVSYINADPNYLAILPVSGVSQDLVFSSVLSGSGTRYAAGKYQWWSTGNSGSLHDTTLGDDAPAMLTCTQINGAS